MTAPITTTPVLDALTRGQEERDAELLTSLYAPAAEIRVVDCLHPPSAPLVVRGIEEIGAFMTDVYSRDMTHEVGDRVGDDQRLAFTTACRYADGTRVTCATVADLDEAGKITRQIVVQAWDE